MSVRRIAQTKSLILLYGAGVSVAAGIEPFERHNDTESRRKWDWNIAFGAGPAEENEWLEWAASEQRRLFQCEPTKFHRWLNLEKSGRIKSIFSMNMDGLEIKSGLIPNVHYYPIRGHFRQMICRKSKKRHHIRPATQDDEELLRKRVFPPCLDCEIETPGEAGVKGMRPGILLDNDQEFDSNLFPILNPLRNMYADERKVDMLLVVGTSLPDSCRSVINQLKKLAKYAIYVDPSPTQTELFDEVLDMTADELAELLGYSDLVESNQVIL